MNFELSRFLIHCISYKCGSVKIMTDKQNEGTTYHELPLDRKYKELWLRKCGRNDLLDSLKAETPSYRLCSKHFMPDQYTDHTMQHLKQNALPSLFDFQQRRSTTHSITENLSVKTIKEKPNVSTRRKEDNHSLFKDYRREDVSLKPSAFKIETAFSQFRIEVFDNQMNKNVADILNPVSKKMENDLPIKKEYKEAPDRQISPVKIKTELPEEPLTDVSTNREYKEVPSQQTVPLRIKTEVLEEPLEDNSIDKEYQKLPDRQIIGQRIKTELPDDNLRDEKSPVRSHPSRKSEDEIKKRSLSLTKKSLLTATQDPSSDKYTESLTCLKDKTIKLCEKRSNLSSTEIKKPCSIENGSHNRVNPVSKIEKRPEKLVSPIGGCNEVGKSSNTKFMQTYGIKNKNIKKPLVTESFKKKASSQEMSGMGVKSSGNSIISSNRISTNNTKKLSQNVQTKIRVVNEKPNLNNKMKFNSRNKKPLLTKLLKQKQLSSNIKEKQVKSYNEKLSNINIIHGKPLRNESKQHIPTTRISNLETKANESHNITSIDNCTISSHCDKKRMEPFQNESGHSTNQFSCNKFPIANAKSLPKERPFNENHNQAFHDKSSPPKMKDKHCYSRPQKKSCLTNVKTSSYEDQKPGHSKPTVSASKSQKTIKTELQKPSWKKNWAFSHKENVQMDVANLKEYDSSSEQDTLTWDRLHNTGKANTGNSIPSRRSDELRHRNYDHKKRCDKGKKSFVGSSKMVDRYFTDKEYPYKEEEQITSRELSSYVDVNLERDFIKHPSPEFVLRTFCRVLENNHNPDMEVAIRVKGRLISSNLMYKNNYKNFFMKQNKFHHSVMISIKISNAPITTPAATYLKEICRNIFKTSEMRYSYHRQGRKWKIICNYYKPTYSSYVRNTLRYMNEEGGDFLFTASPRKCVQESPLPKRLIGPSHNYKSQRSPSCSKRSPYSASNRRKYNNEIISSNEDMSHVYSYSNTTTDKEASDIYRSTRNDKDSLRVNEEFHKNSAYIGESFEKEMEGHFKIHHICDHIHNPYSIKESNNSHIESGSHIICSPLDQHNVLQTLNPPLLPKNTNISSHGNCILPNAYTVLHRKLSGSYVCTGVPTELCSASSHIRPICTLGHAHCNNDQFIEQFCSDRNYKTMNTQNIPNSFHELPCNTCIVKPDLVYQSFSEERSTPCSILTKSEEMDISKAAPFVREVITKKHKIVHDFVLALADELKDQNNLKLELRIGGLKYAWCSDPSERARLDRIWSISNHLGVSIRIGETQQQSVYSTLRKMLEGWMYKATNWVIYHEKWSHWNPVKDLNLEEVRESALEGKCNILFTAEPLTDLSVRRSTD